MQSLGQFAAEITHEINNPIAAISGSHSSGRHPEPQVAEDGKTIRDMADRAGKIVRSLRRFVQEGSAFPASSPHPYIDLNARSEQRSVW
jgi:C4-dicarboxylate-specific signal transduction histidine kinase